MTLVDFVQSPLVIVAITIAAAIYGWHLRMTLGILGKLGEIQSSISALTQSVSDDRADKDIVRWSDLERVKPRRRRGD